MTKSVPPRSWSYAPDAPDLKTHLVDVWRVQVELPEDSRKSLEATLSQDESERAARFHFPADRDRFIIAHGCLRDVLSRYLHCQPLELSFSIGEYGKPALNSDAGIDFNLAHSGDYILIAIAHRRRVGVDVERIRKGISSSAIAQQYFSKVEVAELQELPIEEREIAFFTCWTRKEAYIKAQGMGLTLPLESFDVSLAPNEPAILRATRPYSDEASRWTLYSLQIDPLYEAAIAVENMPSQASEPASEYRLWSWQRK